MPTNLFYRNDTIGPVKIEHSGDLIYHTYHMVDWKKAEQRQSEVRCLQCGGKMNEVEAITDNSGRSYDGLVCHNCKRVLWVRKS